MGRSAAFFDLDKTILATASAAALTGRFVRAGLATRRNALRSAYAQLAYQFGQATAGQTERLGSAMGRTATGWDVDLVGSTTQTALDKVIAPQVFAGATQLIEAHHAAGTDVVICTAAAHEVAQPIAAMLGADHLLATAMEIEDDRYTGQIAQFNYGPAKAEAMHQLADSQGYDLATCFAYSDSITDLPMLEAVGHPVVVNPSTALRLEAERRGWPVMRFATPAPTKRRWAWQGAAWAGAVVAPAVLTWLAHRWTGRRRIASGG